jgi:hypothetical protein
MKLIGLIIFVIGIGLFIGNVSRQFRTFPLAGWATMAVGGAIMKSGN